MALLGKRPNNTTAVDGVSYFDAYIITGSKADPLKNVVRFVGSDTTGSYQERALVWCSSDGIPANVFVSASYTSLLPNGSIVVDLDAKNLRVLSSSVWITIGGLVPGPQQVLYGPGASATSLGQQVGTWTASFSASNAAGGATGTNMTLWIYQGLIVSASYK